MNDTATSAEGLAAKEPSPASHGFVVLSGKSLYWRTGILAIRLVWEQTALTWRDGPQMDLASHFRARPLVPVVDVAVIDPGRRHLGDCTTLYEASGLVVGQVRPFSQRSGSAPSSSRC